MSGIIGTRRTVQFFVPVSGIAAHQNFAFFKITVRPDDVGRLRFSESRRRPENEPRPRSFVNHAPALFHFLNKSVQNFRLRQRQTFQAVRWRA